jgi:predicted transcriptional regulator
MTDDSQQAVPITLTSKIVSAYVAHHRVGTAELPSLIQQVHESLNVAASGSSAAEKASRPKPAVSIRASIKPDYIVCLEDGIKLKTLKRHLGSKYGLSPEEYRERWGLPPDYPMVAPNYAKKRSALARQIGLGRKGKRVGGRKRKAS